MKKILNFLKKILKPTRTKVITVLSLTFLFLSINEIKSSTNGRPGRTGSPSESTCTSCHGGPNANLTVSGGFTNLASGAQYELSTTYEGFITINYTGRNHWGFSVEVLNAQGDNAGILILTDPIYGKFAPWTIAPYIRRELIHTDVTGDCGGANIPNTFTYRFQWVSPAVPMGNITLYYIGLATDDDCNDNSGDYTQLGNVSYTAPPL